ncbi:MAG TPA: 3-keto-5-aminohexanoate cleavage protein [Woeseiaceae bacterium]|nr:3-keto-5-aminohexanoate cleavage protein [Woeseiaceae bacterium]
MTDGIFITCAVTGAGDAHKIHPNLPITPRQIADACIEAAAAGAAIVHVHVRDRETGTGLGPAGSDLDAFSEVVDIVRSSSVDVILNLTTGIGGDYLPSASNPNIAHPNSHYLTPEQRVRHVVALRPEICSMDMGTMNMGSDPIINLPSHISTMSRLVAAAGVIPELEVFDLGHLRLANKLISDQVIGSPPLFQFCLGIDWGAPADVETLLRFKAAVPKDAIWSAFGIRQRQRTMVAQSILLGGNVRVGLEDNLYLRKGEFATNGQLVEIAVKIAEALNVPVLTPKQTRRRLGLRDKRASASTNRQPSVPLS